MTNYTYINGTEADIADVNAGAVDVGAMSYRNGVALDATELAAAVAVLGVAIIKDQTGVAFATQIKRNIAIASLYLNPLA